MTATNICYNFVGFRCSPPSHTISNKLVSKVFAQKKGEKSYDSSNMCSDFCGFRYGPSLMLKMLVGYVQWVRDIFFLQGYLKIQHSYEHQMFVGDGRLTALFR